MVNVVKLLVELVISILAGCFLLAVGLALIPKSLASRIIRFLKPEILADLNNRWMEFVKFVIQQKLYGRVVQIVPGGPNANLYSKLNASQKNCGAIEKNLYFMDLSIDLLRTLNYAIPNAKGESDFAVLAQTFNYLHFYLNKLEKDRQDPNFNDHVITALQEFESNFDGLDKLRWSKDYDKALFKFMANKSYQDTVSYFENQRKALEIRLIQNKNQQELAFREIIDGIMQYPKKAK